MIEDIVRKDSVDFVIEVLSKLISIPTVVPPGDNYGEMVSYLEKLMNDLGFTVKVIEVPNNIVNKYYPEHSRKPRYIILGKNCSGKAVIHFNAHYDVVPGGNGWLVTEPFKPKIINGRIYGRGASDDKGGMASILLMLKLLRDLKIESCVEISFTPDEELGGATGVNYLLDIIEKPRYALVSEPTGINNVWIGNMGIVQALVTCRGIDAHASMPWFGINAFEDCVIIAHGLIRKLKMNIEKRLFMNVNATITLGGFSQGGLNYNMVPGYFSFSIDRRVLPTEKVDQAINEIMEIIEQLRSQVKSQVDIEIINTIEPGIARSNELTQKLMKIINNILGIKPNTLISRWPVDTRYFQNRAIDAITYGPGDVYAAHGPDEYVEINDVVKIGLIYSLLVKELSEED